MTTPTRATKAAGAATPATPAAFVVITNLTHNYQVVAPDETERQAKTLVLRPYESISLRQREFAAAWAEDSNLDSAVERGLVTVEQAAKKAKAMPQEPDTNLDPYERSVLFTVVCGNPEEATRIINMDVLPAYRNEYREYMLTVFKQTLEAARTWLLKWGPPAPLKARLALIEKRLEALDKSSIEVV